MSGFTHIEKQKLERELRMGNGYVLAFINRTFEDFFREVIGIEIYASQFASGSGSKAQRMRAFWQVASDEQLRRLTRGLLEGWDVYAGQPLPDSARILLLQIAKRLGDESDHFVPQNSNETNAINPRVAEKLCAQLIRLSDISPQQRGYEFEIFLKELFNAYGLSARASFRLIGEQIDGSFMLHNETYLLEAKWQNAPVGAADLHIFEGKLGEKASWSRGLFVSNSGFSPDGLQAFGRGKRLVCMDGFDLFETLRLRFSFTDVLVAKVRSAAETGNPFVSIRDLPIR